MNNVTKFIVLNLSFLLLVACGDEPVIEEKIIRPVLYQQVTYAGSDRERTISGTSKSDQVIKLSFRSNGILSELNMNLGQKVKAGELLGKLDNIQAQLNYENSISAKNSSESRMKTAKLNLDRIKALYEKGGSSLSDLEAAKDVYRTAQQDFNSSLRNVDIQKDQINYGYLYASADGEVAAVNVELNENVSAGQVVGTLNSGSLMDIALGVPESFINEIRTDMPVEVSFVSIEDEVFEGLVKEVSPSIDNNTATYPVVVNLINPSPEIRSGMAANVRFSYSNGDQAVGAQSTSLLVPANAVGEDSNGRFVFMLVKEGESVTARKHTITIGELTADGFEVLAGLEEGQLIATAGLQSLLDGQEVTLKASE